MKIVFKFSSIMFLFLSIQVFGMDTKTLKTTENKIFDNFENDTVFNLETDKELIKKCILYTENDTLKLRISERIEKKSDRKNNFTLILPFLTLLLGFVLNRGFDYLLEREKIKKEGERWFAEIRCLTKPLKNQRESIENFLKVLNIEKFETPNLEIHQSLDCEIFKSLDKSVLLKYLNRMEKNFSKSVDISNKIHGFISSLTFYYTDIKKRYENYLNNSLELFEKFNETFQHLIYCVAQYGRKIEKETGQDPKKNKTFNQISNLFEKHVHPHAEDGDIELFSLHSNLLVPLVEITTENRLNDDLLELTHSLSECNNTFKSIKAEKKYLKINYTNINESLLSLETELENILELNKY